MTLASDDHGYDEPMTDDDIEYARECARLADEEAYYVAAREELDARLCDPEEIARDAADPHRNEVPGYQTTDDDPDLETIPW